MIWSWLAPAPARDRRSCSSRCSLFLGSRRGDSHRPRSRCFRSHSSSARRCRCCWRRRQPERSSLAAVDRRRARDRSRSDVWLLPLQLGGRPVHARRRSATRTPRSARSASQRSSRSRSGYSSGRPGVRRRRCAGRVPDRRLRCSATASARGARTSARSRRRPRGSSASRRSKRAAATAEEQARIARELHDVVAHALSVIVVQAGAADDVFERDPKRARDADPRDRRVRAGRRSPTCAACSASSRPRRAEYAPAAGARSRSTRWSSRSARPGSRSRSRSRAAAAAAGRVDLSAYRIVQEALTNSAQARATPSACASAIRYGDELARRGQRRRPRRVERRGGRGDGLIGMRERVALLGGTLDAGPRPDGGYSRRARTSRSSRRCDDPRR